MLGNYDLRKTNDIKAIKNYLKKTFKRLGLMVEENSFNM